MDKESKLQESCIYWFCTIAEPNHRAAVLLLILHQLSHRGCRPRRHLFICSYSSCSGGRLIEFVLSVPPICQQIYHSNLLRLTFIGPEKSLPAMLLVVAWINLFLKCSHIAYIQPVIASCERAVRDKPRYSDASDGHLNLVPKS